MQYYLVEYKLMFTALRQTRSYVTSLTYLPLRQGLNDFHQERHSACHAFRATTVQQCLRIQGNNLPSLLLLEGFNPLTVSSFGEFLTLSCLIVILKNTFVAFKIKF